MSFVSFLQTNIFEDSACRDSSLSVLRVSTVCSKGGTCSLVETLLVFLALAVFRLSSLTRAQTHNSHYSSRYYVRIFDSFNQNLSVWTFMAASCA